ncbi:MAG: class I SAM-dependent methyltransferase [Aquihabitans sp.]
MENEGYREVFEARGGKYDDAMRRWPHVRDEEFGFVVDLAQPLAGEILVDIPSGGGYLGGHLPEGVELIGVEVSDGFIERSGDDEEIVVASGLEAAGLPSASADAIVSIAGMHHEDDHGALFAAWRRILKPGGRLVAADVVTGSAEAEFLDGFVGEWTSTGHAGHYFGDDLARLGTDAGYAEVEVVDRRYHWWAADEAALAAFCTSLFGLEDVTPDLVLEALESGPGLTREDGRVGLRWGLRALVARSAT